MDYFRIDWKAELKPERNDTNYSTSKFMETMNGLVEKYVPLEKVTQKEFKRRYKPWISDNILKKIDEKNKIFKQYVKCKDTTRKKKLLNEFKVLKNEITSLTRSSKKKIF